MAIHIVRLGSDRGTDEGPRLGTVRRPPRGVPKSEFASRNYYDRWLPVLAPSAALMAQGKASDNAQDWAHFKRAYRKEMASADASGVLDLLALLSAGTNLAVGCYCEHEQHCHRSVLRSLLEERGAVLAPAAARV